MRIRLRNRCALPKRQGIGKTHSSQAHLKKKEVCNNAISHLGSYHNGRLFSPWQGASVSQTDPHPHEMPPLALLARLIANEAREAQVRASPSKRYVKTQVDQLEEWLKETPIPYISNDKFSKEGIFHYWHGQLPRHAHVNRTYPDVVRMWRHIHGSPASGDGIERVFTSAGKQHG
jgi:hypothetical protein